VTGRHLKARACLLALLLLTATSHRATAAAGVGAVGWSVPLSYNIPFACILPMTVGICVWLTCTTFGCDVDTSVKYGHFNPDALIEVTNPDGINRVEDPKRIDSYNRNHNNLIHREVNILGHPLAGQLYCPSQADALTPYFLSPLDPLGWQWGIPEMIYPQSLIPGLREIGNWPLNRWGNVYPRSGWTVQYSEPKAAALFAQRSGDIITRSAQPHVYNPMTGQADDGDKFTWEPEGLIENTNEEGWWQMLYPPPADSGGQICEVFGKNDTLSLTGWGGGKVSPTGSYAFTLWRPYTCCTIEGMFLIFHFDYIPYPPQVGNNAGP